MNHKGLKTRWKYWVSRLLREAHKEGKLRMPASVSFLKQYRCFSRMLANLWKMTWYAHIGASLLDPRFSVRYIGRYTQRAVLAEYRIKCYDGKIVRFTFKDYAEGGKTSYATLKVFSFIARLIRHIPDKNFPMIRYYGLFCNRWRERYLAQARAALDQPDPDSTPPEPPPTWAERQAEYTGADPLQCPNCQQPMTFMGAFYGPWPDVQALFEQAGRDPTIPSALLRPG
jgi:hypothetical protein